MTTAIDTQSALDAKIKTVCDVLRRSNCAGALQYVPELTWLLFLRFLDEREAREEADARVQGTHFGASIAEPYRWRDWAAPGGAKRRDLRNGAIGDVFRFLRDDLLPYLHTLGGPEYASPRQRLISQIVSGVDETRVDTEHNFLDVLDHVDGVRLEAVNDRHMFALSQAYEGLLLSMGEKNNDGGQFFTPREIVRAMIRVIEPRSGREGVRPLLRHRRLPRAVVRVYARTARQRTVGDGPRDAGPRDLLRAREGQHRLPDRARQPAAARHRRAAPLARQHPHRYDRIRRALRGRAAAVRRDPHQPALRREGRPRSTDALRLPHVLDAGAVPAGSDRQPRERRARRIRGGRGAALPHRREGVRADQAQAARRVRPLLHRQPRAWASSPPPVPA